MCRRHRVCRLLGSGVRISASHACASAEFINVECAVCECSAGVSVLHAHRVWFFGQWGGEGEEFADREGGEIRVCAANSELAWLEANMKLCVCVCTTTSTPTLTHKTTHTNHSSET